MIDHSQNKMLTVRNQFVVEKAKQGFTPTEIIVLMKREGFSPIARSRVYQILESYKIKAK